MLNAALIFSLTVLSLSALATFYRIWKGPSTPDRVIALDALGIYLIAVIGVVSIMLRTQAYVDIILLIGILSFLGTIAFSKYLERGVVLENERDASDRR